MRFRLEVSPVTFCRPRGDPKSASEPFYDHDVLICMRMSFTPWKIFAVGAVVAASMGMLTAAGLKPDYSVNTQHWGSRLELFAPGRIAQMDLSSPHRRS